MGRDKSMITCPPDRAALPQGGCPHWHQLKRDCEGRPPFTWGLGLCPNFLTSSAPPAAARKKGKRAFRGHPEAPAGRLAASLHSPQQACAWDQDFSKVRGAGGLAAAWTP